MPSPIPLTAAQFWSMLTLLSQEIEEAVVIFHTAEKINQLALQDSAILRVLNEEPLFWQAYRSTGQTALFMALGRIFDSARDGHSIHKVVSATVANLQLFSAQALRTRRAVGGEEPKWLTDFIAAAWVPTTSADLRHLKRDLAQHTKSFEEIYRPIRNSVYGHRLMSNDEAAARLFPKTNRDEVCRIIDYLHELIDAIIDLYNNGNKPELGRRDFTEYNQRVRDEAERVLRKLTR